MNYKDDDDSRLDGGMFIFISNLINSFTSYSPASK